MGHSINVVILIAGSLCLCAGAYALNRSRRGQVGEAEPPPSSQGASDEVELLRYENAMLRGEQQRSLSLGKAGERVREHFGNVITSGTDEGDDAWSTLTEATVLRDTMLAVCQDLQTAIRNVQVQLSSGIPIPELDRRKTDREPQAAACERDLTVTQLPDHAQVDLPVAQEAGS